MKKSHKTVHVSLYGEIAQYGGGKYIASFHHPWFENMQIRDLLSDLGLPDREKGYLFINSILCDAPGLNASLQEELHPGDHIGIFSIKHMWPYQYRDGIHMSDNLVEAMAEKGVMRNTYRK